ncbi:unnamed protein product [Mytilus edulis]|uniref:B box-type domain-containing protein n=1 Tax=Mytilus edulis TaxID=6550 RepID=A0A8S3VL56_MYTED|nr:unnamed protein product [Mytilus edulis]
MRGENAKTRKEEMAASGHHTWDYYGCIGTPLKVKDSNNVPLKKNFGDLESRVVYLVYLLFPLNTDIVIANRGRDNLCVKWTVNLVICWIKNSAVQWCMSCHERLCLECSIYHKALTATKDHNLISTKQYEAMLPFLKSVEIKCCHHSEKDLEYFCKEHECFCCIICKRETHIDCRKVEKIEEIISETDLTSELKHMNNRYAHAAKDLSKLTNLIDVNIFDLDKAKEEIFHQMQSHRMKINNALDSIENNIKQDINKSFKEEKSKLRKQKYEYKKKTTELEKEQEIIHEMLKTDIKSNKRMFFVQRNIQNKLTLNELFVENFVSSLQMISSNCKVGTSIDKNAGSVKFTKTIEFNRNTCKFDLQSLPLKDEHEETASSNVEAEEMMPSDKSQKKDSHTNIPDFKISPVSTNYTFKYKRHILLTSVNSNSKSAYFIKSISKKSVVVWTPSEKYLLFVDTESKTESKIYLQFPPRSIAIIDDNTIAVTSCMKIVFVNTQTLTCMHTLHIGDHCFGIDFTQNKLLVNCESKGLKVMDVKGNVSKSFENITGKLQLCLLNSTIVAIGKQGVLFNQFVKYIKCKHENNQFTRFRSSELYDQFWGQYTISYNQQK